MAIVFVGIDLAKNLFAGHGVNEASKAAAVKPAVARAKLEELVASLEPCVIGMEACSGERGVIGLGVTGFRGTFVA